MLTDWARAAGFAAVLAVALSGALFWALNYPAPSHAPSGQQQERHSAQAERETAGQPRGTESAPVVVKILPPAPGSPEAARDEEERTQKSSIDRGLLYFTAVLAVATIALVVVTLGLVGFASRQSEETRILQRAYVSVNPEGIQTDSLGKVLGHVLFENAGHLPARDFRWSVKVTKDGSGDWTPPKIVDADLEGFAVLPVGAKWKMGSSECNPKPDFYWDYVYVWGRVEYTDGFDVPRHTEFCHRYLWGMHKTWVENGMPVDAISTDHARFHVNGNDAN